MSEQSDGKKPDLSACGLGCNCGTSGSGGRGRMVVGIVILIVAGVLVVRAVVKDNGAETVNTAIPGFAALPAAVTTAPGTPTVKQVPVADTLKELGSLSELNYVAGDTFGVFVYLPSKGETSGMAPMAQLRNAVRTIEAQLRSGKIGIFTLKVGSQDYEQLVMQMAVPGVVAMVKGGGISAISGDITETKLIQALVIASRAGGCGAGGCGPRGCN